MWILGLKGLSSYFLHYHVNLNFLQVFFCCQQEQHKVVLLEGCEMSDCNIDKKQFAFRIKPRGAKRVYFFCADTEQDQQEWMQAICFAKASGHMGDGSQACTVQ